MQKILGLILIMASMSTVAMASPVPEIDATSGGAALGLLAGVLLVIRGRRAK